ncbi:hypothetical protein [Saccharospirillum salsuginis]|uniref:Uncharacterized protein n=1 Tax=Saccharospirillum salsuginis TaxID=418750 RepID=A0A918N5Y4_9GAMM|nr:hypothetical protein [Saccharospirillum salsuginis]GGX43791.1 hypothetical protein GCM10007392_08180 [Saccharospirillum salsuginis]
MDLIRRYSDAVTEYLPPAERRSVGDELYDDLCEQYAEQSHETGSEEHQLTFLRQQPPPMKMARRFIGERYLIGPDLYLPYIRSLRVATVLVAALHLLLWVVKVALGEGGYIQTTIQQLASFPGTWLVVAGILTLVFAVFERTGERIGSAVDWRPEVLRSRDVSVRIPVGETLFDMVVALVALLWWNGAVRWPLRVEHAGETYAWSLPEISVFVMVLVNVLLVIDLVFAAFKLIRHYWRPSIRSMDIAINLIWMGLLLYAIQADALLVYANEPLPETLVKLQSALELSIRLGLTVVVAILGWEVLSQGRRLLNRT